MSSLREEIAVAAARLVVDEGMEYAAAKKRALREMGMQRSRQAELPSNEQLEDEIRTHIALFCADTQPAELRALREAALVWMERLADFRPHLSGAVWRGTATRLSAVRLDLYCDDPKAAQIALINKGVDFDAGHLERPGKEPLTVLTVGHRSHALGDVVTIHLSLHDTDDQRGALKPDARGRSWRGDLVATRRLLEEGAAR
jgi:hypothetical protein